MNKTRYSEQLAQGQLAAMTGLMGLASLPFALWLTPQITLYLAALLGLRMAALRWPRLTPGRWPLLPLTVAGVVNVLSAYATLNGRDAGSALLATMLLLKLLEVRGKRDLRLLTSLFGFLLASQFLFDQSPQLVAYLLVLLVANLALMADLTARADGPAVRGALRLAGRMVLLALPLAIVLFLLFPRLDAPLWRLGGGEAVGITGFSDRLELGTVTRLVLSGELAFRVWFDEAAPPLEHLYWRGPVLWESDGRRWSAGSAKGAETGASPLAEAGDALGYRVVMEPNNEHWLLALDLPVEIPEHATLTADRQVLIDEPLTDTARYRMVSATRYNTGPLAPHAAAAGLQLPGNITPRMRKLVGDWTADGAADATVVARALAYFNREPFHYTLAPPPLGGNPTDQFLFETRRGYCEHYASAFALLMRLAGIPTRIVLGYHGAEPNPMGGYHIVWQSDAHAWTEVWLPGQGWRRVDPTAAVATERIERGPLLEGLGANRPARFAQGEPGRLAWLAHRLRLASDALQTGWQNWVLDFSTSEQMALLSLIGLGYLSQYGLAVAMILAAAAVLALTVLSIARKRPRTPLEVLYARFSERLARVGLPRGPQEGPLDYSQRVLARRPDLRPQVEPFIGLYIRLRYAGTDTERWLPLLRRHLRRVRPRRQPGGQRSPNP